jgi:large subunit ribosomal protein L25
MAQVDLNVELRDQTGKGVARRLRAAGHLPGVVYGKDLAPQPIIVDPKGLAKSIEKNGWNVLYRLKGAQGLDGKVVILKDADIDPLSRDLVSADFHAINLTEKSEFTIPVNIVGTAAGQEEGGSLDLIRKELDVYCLPSEVPNEIDIDVSALEIGDTIHIEDVVPPAGVEMVFDVNFTVVTVSYIHEEVEEDLEEDLEDGVEVADAAEGEGEDEEAED